MTVYKRTVRPLLFRLDPEQAHQLTIRALRLGGPVGRMVMASAYRYENPALYTTVFGLGFRNPIGLAAGYDKNGRAVKGLAALGFGHIEVGTVTVRQQDGNPKPRIFRLVENEAIINRMGFPNDGLVALMRGLPKAVDVPLGINIGKGKHTPLSQAHHDYIQLMTAVYGRADYVVVNVSSPNTLNLRKLQAKAALYDVLARLLSLRDKLAQPHQPPKPLLVKIAPDLTWAELDDVLDVCMEHGIEGIVATNTTILRPRLTGPHRTETGGLSGLPLKQHSTEVVRYIYRRTAGKLTIIGVGGVNSAEAALEKIRAGAALVQVYTGLVYEGPGLIGAINKGIASYLAREGIPSIGDLVGSEAQD